MRFVLIGLVMLAGCLSSQAQAGSAPIFAAAPDWVELPQPPASKAEQSGQPIELLMLSMQTSHSANASARYFESMTKVQTAEGLATAGNVAIAWQPEQSDLVIHKLEVIRDGHARDVLAAQKLSILRREPNLEAASIDGMLTATIQIDDLRVGDMVHLAYSRRAGPGTIGHKPEDWLSFPPGAKGNLVLLRELWPDSVPMRWAASPAMGALKVRKTKFGNELRAEFRNLEVPPSPPSAPPRFAATMFLQTSAYRDWGEASALLAPLYAKAAALTAGSPLKAEARSIRAAVPTPEARALAALRLVQDKIRYLGVFLNEGGVVPASADETWQRRFGDCKGKAATLLALLHELDIEAEPVLVDVSAGDALPSRLPALSLFDHVLVRATIGGKSYWLDGTRSSDLDLQELASSSFGHALPIRAAGATLIEVPLAPASSPQTELKLTWDARAGYYGPASAQGEMVYHGNFAAAMKAALARAGETEFKKAFDDPLYLSGAIDRTLSFKVAPDDGSFSVLFSGKVPLDWLSKGGPADPNIQLSNIGIRWQPDFPRREGANARIPVSLDFPVYATVREEVILPDQGKGFSLVGKSFDRTVAGTRISRSLALENGRAVAISQLIRLKPEISAEEATASTPILAGIAADAAYVVAPRGLYIGAWDPSRAPATADDFIDRGYGFLDGDARRYADSDFERSFRFVQDSLADFDRAIALSPESSLAHALRALALSELGRLDDAKVAIDKAHSVKSVHPKAFQVRGVINALRNRPAEAIPDLSRFIAEYNPNSLKTLIERGLAYEKIGQLEKARGDLERAASLAAGPIASLPLARVLVRLGKPTEAIAMIDRVMQSRSYDGEIRSQRPQFLDLDRGTLLEMVGLPEQARASYDAGLGKVDARLKQLPPPSGPELSDHLAAQIASKVRLLVLAGRITEAIATADQALKAQPYNIPILVSRCAALMHGSAPGQLARARQDCDAATQRAPMFLEAQYFSALVSLKAGEWPRAKREFDHAAQMKSPSPGFLLGRGIAKLRLGEMDSGLADIHLARQISPESDFDFLELGIKPEAAGIVPAPVVSKAGLSLYSGFGSGEPETPEGFLARGYDRLEKWQMVEALADFDRVVALAPDSSLAQSLRGLVLVRLGRLDQAEAAIQKAFASSPVEPRSYQVRGLLNARRGHPDKAIPDLSHDLQPGAVSAPWLLARGLAYEQTGQFERARTDLQQVVDLAPSVPVRLALARVTARLGNVAGAISLVDTTVTGLDANLLAELKTYVLAMRRGRILGMAGRVEAAHGEYAKALQAIDARLGQWPTQGDGLLQSVGILQSKADLLIRMGRSQEAVAIANQALTISPDNVDILTVRCHAYLQIPGDLAKARQDCDAALQKQPANTQASYMSGMVSLVSNDQGRAEGEFDALVKATNRAPGPMFGRGIAKLRRGEKAEGAADIEFARSQSGDVDAEFEEVGIKP